MARVLIVDDHDTVRNGIRVMLAGEPGIEIAGEASNGLEALHLCRRVRPDLVLMDVRMPELDGLAATRSIKRRFPDISVLMLTMYENQDYLLEAIRAGAAGYVLKDAPQQHLVTAIRKVLEGETTLNRAMANKLIYDLANNAPRPGGILSSGTSSHSLTPRELEVLELLALGKTNREIAQQFVLSVGTIKNHVEHIISKLGVSDRTQAVVRALEQGIITFPKS
ncbi:response regulator transcription factor [Rubrobacter taiwanensis]|uniref:Response regulator transcription factor n=1 Tax=Rubrobacter taiwanensis TaxID=185139 RepID=A0A4R1BRE4_9ACTN|nr:response regulator transcription factor [Rubrobacter taiwanensis]TCJ20314.1 response regulator transcription factor [Rubrobacter taiwanensis]